MIVSTLAIRGGGQQVEIDDRRGVGWDYPAPVEKNEGSRRSKTTELHIGLARQIWAVRGRVAQGRELRQFVDQALDVDRSRRLEILLGHGHDRAVGDVVLSGDARPGDDNSFQLCGRFG